MAATLMGVIMLNVILRIFGAPLKGIVEYVQFLTALSVGLGLAHCGAQGGHVAITFLTDKFSQKVQGFLSTIIDGLVAIFLAISAWELFQYGIGMKESGEIALSTGIVVYPFVFVIAASFFIYLLVLLLGMAKTLQNMFSPQPVIKEVKDSEDETLIDL